MFAWPEKRGIASTVIRSADTWQARSPLIPHEAFRWLHSELRLALENFDPSVPGQEWQAKAMGEWLREYYLESIHHHHDAEEDVYNPWLAALGAEIPPSIASDHRELVATIEVCLGLAKSLVGGDASAANGLKRELAGMMDMLEVHFDMEDEYYSQVLIDFNVTQAEEGEAVGRINQDMGLEGCRVLLPLVVYAMYAWGGPEVVEQFKGNVPPPVWAMLESDWLDDFFCSNLRVVRRLQGRAEPELAEGAEGQGSLRNDGA